MFVKKSRKRAAGSNVVKRCSAISFDVMQRILGMLPYADLVTYAVTSKGSMLEVAEYLDGWSARIVATGVFDAEKETRCWGVAWRTRTPVSVDIVPFVMQACAHSNAFSRESRCVFTPNQPNFSALCARVGLVRGIHLSLLVGERLGSQRNAYAVPLPRICTGHGGVFEPTLSSTLAGTVGSAMCVAAVQIIDGVWIVVLHTGIRGYCGPLKESSVLTTVRCGERLPPTRTDQDVDAEQLTGHLSVYGVMAYVVQSDVLGSWAFFAPYGNDEGTRRAFRAAMYAGVRTT
jgi:hypothetical protein